MSIKWGYAKIKAVKVRTRIAPSPTGFAHIGTAYQTVFNYGFTKQQKGKFIIRIEDTDVKRHLPGAEKAIFEGLAWLGLKHDEGPDVGGKHGPYRQSERLETYKKYAQQLLKKKLAFKDEGAIRFKVPEGITQWQDLIRGEIKWNNDQIKDFVIIKSDGFPTYNFAVVIDDLLMKISHVIRGEEHISNTPRQLMIYQALDKKPPLFAHTPLLRNPDRSKVSKRNNPVALEWYKKQGYLPEAIVNFLCLMGWSHPKEKDVFDINEFIKYFSFKRISTSAPVFDLQKLDWLNGVYIRKKSDKQLLQLIKPLAPRGMKSTLINQTIPLIKDRLIKLSDYPDLIDFFIKEPKVDKKLLIKKSQGEKVLKEQFKKSVAELRKTKDWQAKKLEKLFRDLAKKNKWHIGKYFMATRIALTGKTATPPLFETMEVLGKEKTLKRLTF